MPGITDANDQKRLRDLIAQKSGEPLDRERIRQSIQAIHATGRFADIRAEAERTADGQSVTVVLLPLPTTLSAVDGGGCANAALARARW